MLESEMGKTKRNRPDREREWAGRFKYKDDLETEREDRQSCWQTS